MTIKELLEIYYRRLAQKEGWDSVLSEDFRFVGGDMTKTTPVAGRQAYIDVVKRFAQLFQTVRVKEMMIEDDRACVIANYDYVFPKGETINGNVAEIWKVRNGKLDELTLFFDTLTFNILTRP